MSIPVGQAVELDIWQGQGSDRFQTISEASTYNLFEFPFSNKDRAMIPTAGFELLHEIAEEGQWRGIFYSNVMKGILVGIANDIWFVTPSNKTLLFGMTTLSGKIYFAENAIMSQPTDENPGGQFAVSDRANIYVYQIDGTVTRATNDGGLELGFQPGMIDFQDDTFFCNDVNSNQIFQSEINDARAWPAVKFGTIDNETVGCLTFKTMLFVFGNNITQIFHDTANPPPLFTYSKDTNRSFEYGAINAESIAQGLDFFAWLGRTLYSQPSILMSTGGDPITISTPGIDAILNNLTAPADNNAFIYDTMGHTFYQINFFTDNLSLIYDFTVKKWYRVSNENYGMHPVQGVAVYQGGNESLAISSDKGHVYKFGLNYYTNDGEVIPRSIITPNLVDNERNKVCTRLDLELEEGENQQLTRVRIYVSKDRGRIYRQYKNLDMGPVGQRKRLLRFHQFGASRWWTFKMEFWTRDRIVIFGARGYFL